jgi:DNA-directed RNA polymerase specialized sigma24 family protein
MTKRAHMQVSEDTASLYGSREDFRGVFSEDLNGLYQVSLLLTRDPQRAERCFVAGLEDSGTEHPLLGESARSWAKRIIVKNAIYELQPRPRQSHSSSPAIVFPYFGQLLSGPDGHFELEAILALEDFERLVFVISVLEHYSVYECALLLESSVAEVRDARSRALEELIDSLHVLVPNNQVVAQEMK